MHLPLHPRPRTLAAFVLGIFCAGCSSGFFARGDQPTATVTFTAANGSTIGSAQLRQTSERSVNVEVTASSLTPGSHGIHFHAVGLCEGATNFSTAGAHYNPLNKRHGLAAPGGPHAGDAPNLVAGSDGRATITFTTDRVTLASGPTSLFDADGSALVIHAAADDQVTDPSGNSGARVACGVVRSTP